MPKSLAERVAELSELTGQLSEALRDFLPPDDGPKVIRITSLVQVCPNTLAELPEWFAKLSPEQLDKCWVQAIVHVLTMEENWSIRDLALALLAVREHPNVPIFALESNQPQKQPVPQPGDSEIMATIEGHDQGDGVILSSVFDHKGERARAAAAVRRSPNWELTKEEKSVNGGRPRFVAIRKAKAS